MKPKQIKCLELMVQGELTDKEIAEAINISPKTICDWKKNNEEFWEIQKDPLKALCTLSKTYDYKIQKMRWLHILRQRI